MYEREKEAAKRQLQSPLGKKASTDTFKLRDSKPNGRIDSIEASMKSDMISSNMNRVAILHLLKMSPRNEMQAEKLAQAIGVSHRTALYHLGILEDYELVQVKGFRKKGQKMLRSVWGLNTDFHAEKVCSRIYKRFAPEEIRKILKVGCNGNGYAR